MSRLRSNLPLRNYLALLIFLAWTSVSCANVQEYVPSAHARSAAQHAYAAYATYAILLTTAAKVAENPDTPRGTVMAIGLASETAQPFLDQLKVAFTAYQELAAIDGTPRERLDEAAEALMRAVEASRVPMGQLIEILNK